MSISVSQTNCVQIGSALPAHRIPGTIVIISKKMTSLVSSCDFDESTYTALTEVHIGHVFASYLSFQFTIYTEHKPLKFYF